MAKNSDRKNSSWPIVAAVVLLAGLFLISLGKKPPLIPADDTHRGLTTEEACTACHAPGKAAPLKPSHPPKEQCLICHKVRT